MTDSTRPEDTAPEESAPQESAEDLGNTIDGSGAGDGSTTRGADESDYAAGPDRVTGDAPRQDTAGVTGSGETSGASEAAFDTTPGAGGGRSAQRDEQKKVYQTPDQPDRAVGGSDGTADGQ